jgi:hypothetical protein
VLLLICGIRDSCSEVLVERQEWGQSVPFFMLCDGVLLCSVQLSLLVFEDLHVIEDVELCRGVRDAVDG